MSLVEQTRPRLPVPAGTDPGQWRVLTEILFPTAKSAASIQLAMEYCKARGLDIMKKPVNIVPVWNSELRRQVETIWPSIGEAQITAARTQQWAGMDPPKFGERCEQKFKGKDGPQFEVAYPEWCEVTVYRLIGGERCAFTERVYWEEAYGRQGNTHAPNMMWSKRPHGQLQKVAKAAVLRAAFPEEIGSLPTEDEMHGAVIDEADEPPAKKPAPKYASTPEEYTKRLKEDLNRDPIEKHDPATGEVSTTIIPLEENMPWQDWGHLLLASVREQKTIDGIDVILSDNAETLTAMNEAMPKLYATIVKNVNQTKLALLPKDAP